MNIIDIGIVVFLAFGAILGFKRGFTNELVKTVGLVVIVVIAFLFKAPLSNILYEHLPFFNFGFLKGAAILNILVYEIIAFIILVVILSIILKILMVVTSLFEKFLTATIVLGIPSKIAGAIIGLVYEYIVVFIVLYIMTLAGINVSLVNDSQLRNKIINETPLLSGICNNSLVVIDEFRALQADYGNKSISQQDFNYKAMELFLKYKIISSESASKLIEEGKLDTFNYYEDLLNKFKEA